jgi:small subunit ribosomal protein S16
LASVTGLPSLCDSHTGVAQFVGRIYGHQRGPSVLEPSCQDSKSVSLESLHRISAQGIHMVVIRLARGGAKKRPFYNIVVADSRNRRDGRFIERLGFYNPVASGAAESLRVSMDRVTYWTGVGAQLSPAVARLVEVARKTAQA